jgi:hypothetical protein
MRGLFGLVGLLVALAAVGLVVRKQMVAVQAPVPALQTPADGVVGAPLTPANTAQQGPQIQEQVKAAVDAAMQPRPMPDDK